MVFLRPNNSLEVFKMRGLLLDVPVGSEGELINAKVTEHFRAGISSGIVAGRLFGEVSHSLELSVVIIIIIGVPGVHIKERSSIASKVHYFLCIFLKWVKNYLLDRKYGI